LSQNGISPLYQEDHLYQGHAQKYNRNQAQNKRRDAEFEAHPLTIDSEESAAKHDIYWKRMRSMLGDDEEENSENEAEISIGGALVFNILRSSAEEGDRKKWCEEGDTRSLPISNTFGPNKACASAKG